MSDRSDNEVASGTAARPGAARTPGSSGRLAVLVICDDAPADGLTGDGNTSLALHVLDHLVDEFEVTLVWFGTGTVPETLRRRCAETRAIAALGPARALPRSVVARLPRSAVARDYASARRLVHDLSRSVDVTYVLGPKALALAMHVVRPVVVNEIDPLSLYWRDRAATACWPRRIAAAYRARTLFRLEQLAAAAVDTFAVVSDTDAAEAAAALDRPVVSLPLGVRSPRRTLPVAGRRQISFLGALDHRPNIDGVRALCAEVVPMLREYVADVRVVVAGRSPTAQVRELAAAASAQLLPGVSDPFVLYAQSAVAVFPGGFGRGVRNSVLEALRAGCPVVASTASARGIASGPHITRADDTRQFADAVARLLCDDVAWQRARQAAQEFGAALPTWRTAAARHGDVLRDAVRGHRAGVATTSGCVRWR